jgi:hypothetical protein
MDVDKFVNALQGAQKEFSVDPSVLQSYQLLIQWVTNLALHIAASIPDFKHRRGPGVRGKRWKNPKPKSVVTENFSSFSTTFIPMPRP